MHEDDYDRAYEQYDDQDDDWNETYDWEEGYDAQATYDIEYDC